MKTLNIGVATLAIAAGVFAGRGMAAQVAPALAASAAQQAFEAGQLDQSLQLIAEARGRNEAGLPDTFLAAQVQLKRNQNEAAKAELAQLAAAGDDVLRLVAESSNAMIDGNFDGSLELANQAVNAITARTAAIPPGTPVDPAAQLRDFPAFYQLGLVKARRQDWQGSAEAFEHAALLNPSFAYAYYYAGNAWSRLRQADRVSANFERFLKLAPNAPERPAVSNIMRTIRGN